MMERLRSSLGSLVLLLVGLLVGWLVIGWWLLPNRANATPPNLGNVYQQDYFALVADSYALNGNTAIAQQRLQGFDLAYVARSLEDLARASDAQQLVPQAVRMRALTAAIQRGDLGKVEGLPTSVPTTTVPTPAPEAASGGIGASLRRAFDALLGALGQLRLGWLLGLALGVALIIGLIGLLRRRQTAFRPPPQVVSAPTSGGQVVSAPQPATRGPAQPSQGGLPVYVTLNQHARIAFDADDPQSADIRIFDDKQAMVGQVELRESEILRAHPDDPPPSLELRMLDRLDKRTVGAVLVSRDAMDDPTARQLVAEAPTYIKKPAIPVERTGRIFNLNTEYIKLEAEIIHFEFEAGSHYPAFRSLVLEVTPMSVEPSGAGADAGEDEGEEDDEQATANLAGDDDEDEDEDDTPLPPRPPRSA